jgi:hypothetical protein
MMPPDALFVGTINSFTEEATRVPLSGPVKRRANVMEMPNVLFDIVKNDDRSAFDKAVRNLLVQAEKTISSRMKEGAASGFDPFRLANLQSALSASSAVLSPNLLDPLWEIVQACAVDAGTALTMGVLQDVLEYVAMDVGDRDLLNALDEQIAQKIAPQLSGPSAVVEAVLNAVRSFQTSDALFERSDTVLSKMAENASHTGRTYFPY